MVRVSTVSGLSSPESLHAENIDRVAVHLPPLFTGMLKRGTVDGVELTPIEHEVNISAMHNNGDEEVANFVMRLFLALDPTKRPTTA